VKERRKVSAELDGLVGQRHYRLAQAAGYGLTAAERRAEAAAVVGWPK
jgi:hypothetical protein